MRFCMITTFYPPYSFGGDAVFVQAISRLLAERGHRVDVIHCMDSYRALGENRSEDSAQPEHPAINFTDQPDNAFRVERLGAGRTIRRSQYDSGSAERELRVLLERPSYARAALAVSRAMANENGAGAACDAIERCF